MYLVKALTAARAPIAPGVLANFAAGSYATVQDTELLHYQNNPAAFTVIAGPDFAAVTAAALAQSVAGGAALALEMDYAGTGASFQPVAVTLNLDDAAGSNDGTAPNVLAAVEGTVTGADITGEGNYLAGMIGTFDLDNHGSAYPAAGVIGRIADGTDTADAAVLALIDGAVGSGVTQARAAFGVRIVNDNPASGVMYGLDLMDDGSEVDAHLGNSATPFTPSQAEVRLSNGVCILTGDGAPVDYAAAVAASKTYASAGANNDLTVTAKVAGAAGNAYSVSCVQATDISVGLSVAYAAGAALITLPSDGAGAPAAATANEVKIAWDASDAFAVMTIAVEGTGEGTVAAFASAALENGAEITGTGRSYAEVGSIYIRTATGKLYVQGGTKAEPVWKIVTSA